MKLRKQNSLNLGRALNGILVKGTGLLEDMFKGLKKIKGGIVRDPMFVVCCVINNNTFEL